MENSNVELLFKWLDQTTVKIQQQEDIPYLDSLAIALETLFFEQTPSGLTDILEHQLKESLKTIQLNEYDVTVRRKAIQLAILKGMKDSTQPNHLMTPETVALLVSYLIEKLLGQQETLRLFDLVSGTGNLLITVIRNLDKMQVDAFASEIDSTLLKLSVASANLQETSVEFFQQDSLQPFLLDPVDVTIGDLPVGYYPDAVRANEFELKANEGHSYAHHLLIEQGINYTKNGGFLIFVIPNSLFASEQTDQLLSYLHKQAHIVGLVQLPETFFKVKEHAKSILILQKKGKNTNTPRQPLLVKMPSLKNTTALEDILRQMDSWFTHNQLNR